MKQSKNDSEEYEYYTDKEIEALDKYQDFTEHYFDDDELYDIIIKYKYDDEKIKNELSDMLRGVKRGDEYKWHEYGKSKSIFSYNSSIEKKEEKNVEPEGNKKTFKKTYQYSRKENGTSKGNYYKRNNGNRYYNNRGSNGYRRGTRGRGVNRAQNRGVEAVEVVYTETVIPEKNEVVVEKIYEVKEPMPESTPEIVKEVIITKVEPEVEKVSMKPKHPKKEEKKEIVEVKEETIAPKEEEPKKDNLVFNQVKTEQIEIVKEKPKEEPKKEIQFEKSHNNFQIKTEPKPISQPSTPQQPTQPQYPQMPYGYPYPMFMPPTMDQKNPNGQLYYMLVPTYVPYDPNDQSKPKYPMYPYAQPVQGEYGFNPYMYAMPPQMYGKNDK